MVTNELMFRHTLVSEFLTYSAERYPDKVALVHLERRLTYGEIESMANRLAFALIKHRIGCGDRVAIFMDNAIEAVISIFAALKAGAAFMVISHTTKAKKLEYILNNSMAKILLCQSSRLDVVRDIDSPYLEIVIVTSSDISDHASCIMHQIPNVTLLHYEEVINSYMNDTVRSRCIDLDLAAIIYTSGSTGYPKGVMLSHLNMVSAAHSITTFLKNNENDVIVNVLPLSFDYGLYQILMGFLIGGRIILEKSFIYPYQVIDIMVKEKVTGLPGVPTIFAILLQMKNIHTYDLSSLRYITNTAAALPVSHIRRLRELFPQARLYSMYGLTECKRVSYLPPEELDRRPHSVGKAMPNEEVYIINGKGERVGPEETGELVVRGANVMLGYWEMPEEMAQCLKPGKYPGERVLYTNDLFKMDKDGYLYFIARKDDIIKCGGQKVSPKEIENAAYSLEDVIEASAVGTPDEIMGQAIKLFVVLRDGSKLTARDLLEHCSNHLEQSIIPKYIEIVSSLPKTAAGKICRDRLEKNFSLNSILSYAALRVPDKVAVIQGQRRITFGELDHKASQIASFFIRNRFQIGSRIGILSENSPEYIISYFGIQKSGGIAVDINPQYSAFEIKKILNNCLAEALIVEDKYLRSTANALSGSPSVKTLVVIDPHSTSLPISKGVPSHINVVHQEDIFKNEDGDCLFPEVSRKDIASIIYTSGTTGEPKGVMLSHENFISNAESIIEYLGLTMKDSVMVVLPFYYSYGKSILTTYIMAGGTIFLENSFMYPNVILNRIVEEEITGFAGVPSTFSILLNRSNIRNYRFPNLRYITQAGGPMPPKHALELSAKLPGVKIYIMYGQTEATARLTYLEPEKLLTKPGSIGMPIPGVHIELIKDDGSTAGEGEEGEIVVQGKNVMIGYWNNPEETRKVLRDGKLYTGDIAKMDNDGYLYIVGRRSDIIKSGAHRISPKEIEEVILEINEIHEVSVVGIPDEILGETIRAVIVLKDGHQIDAKKVQRYCQGKLAQFKVPKEVIFVSELPKTSSGKIQRHLLKENSVIAQAVPQ